MAIFKDRKYWKQKKKMDDQEDPIGGPKLLSPFSVSSEIKEAEKGDFSVENPFRNSKEFHLKSPIPSQSISISDMLSESSEETDEAKTQTENSSDYRSDSSFRRPASGVFTYEDYCELERVYADSVIKNKDLIREQERIADDLETRGKQVEEKTLRINQLLRENASLVGQLRKERKLNEQEFNSWADTKAELEMKLGNLRDAINRRDGNIFDTSVSINDLGTDSAPLVEKRHREIEKLKKKVMILAKENELEVHSKMLIIDELELVKEKYSEMEKKYSSLKSDYDGLVAEFSSHLDETSPSAQNSGEEAVVSEKECVDKVGRAGEVSALEMVKSAPSLSVNSRNSIDLRKMSTSSSTSTSTVHHVKRLSSELRDLQIKTLNVPKRGEKEQNQKSSSLRVSSLNKFIKDVELQAQEQKHSQQVTKLKFQIRSLELQNEKLHSYIGFVLQQLDGHSASRPYEYSDEVNIRSAKQTLRTVIRSASAYPLRRTAFDKHVKGLQRENQRLHNRRSTQSMHRHTGDGFVGASASLGGNSYHGTDSRSVSADDTDSLASDYDLGGQVEFVDLGDTETFNGKDFRDPSSKNSQMSILSDVEEFENKENNDPNNVLNDLDPNRSLSVSFEMDFKPPLYMKGKKRSRILKHSPVRQLQKLTAFNLSAQNSISSLRNAADCAAESKNVDSEKVLVENAAADELFSGSKEPIDGSESITSGMDDLEREYVINGLSDGEISEMESIPKDEVDRFKIVIMRNYMFPLHSITRDFYHSNGCIDPDGFYLAISPILALRRSLKNYHRRKFGTVGQPHRKKATECDTEEEYEADESETETITESTGLTEGDADEVD